jgi:hypothetical protein
MGPSTQLATFTVALALGAVFARFEFGFTAAFRTWLREGDGRALAATFAIPAIAALIVLPIGATADGYGRFVSPINFSLAIGAILFGVGMQVANGCGSGTLVAAGQGSRRMLLILPFFCLGGVAGSLLLPFAEALPGIGPVDLAEHFGPWGGLVVMEALLGAGAILVARGALPDRRRLMVAALIGILAAALFLASGQPWGITMGLTVIGAKGLQASGFNLGATAVWSADWAQRLLREPLATMPGAVSDIGLLLGAFAATVLTGRFRHSTAIGWRGAIGAALGGLFMGVGARLSYGCNIGAFASGAASGSLHGIVWFVAVLPGCAVGIRFRRVFGLESG